MTFLNILGDTEIYSFRLVLEGKTGKAIRESSRLELRQHLWSIQKWRYRRFFFVENTSGNWPKVSSSKPLGSDELFCFISKFGSFKNPFATITSLFELCFRFRRFMLLVQMEKVISMNYGSSTSS